MSEKEADEFYTSDKHKCKECIRANVRNNRLKNIDHYRKFDKERANDPDRVLARSNYAKTEAGRESHNAATQRYAVSNKKRRTAQVAVNNAVRDGRLIPWPSCAAPECDGAPQAHHPDYDQPLDVVWLCPSHHRGAHSIVLTTT